MCDKPKPFMLGTDIERVYQAISQGVRNAVIEYLTINSNPRDQRTTQDLLSDAMKRAVIENLAANSDYQRSAEDLKRPKE